MSRTKEKWFCYSGRELNCYTNRNRNYAKFWSYVTQILSVSGLSIFVDLEGVFFAPSGNYFLEFREDELHHRDTAIEGGAQDAQEFAYLDAIEIKNVKINHYSLRMLIFWRWFILNTTPEWLNLSTWARTKRAGLPLNHPFFVIHRSKKKTISNATGRLKIPME